MKKLVLVSLKTFAFFVGWAICASILPIPDTKSAAVWRFWAELIPFCQLLVLQLFSAFINSVMQEVLVRGYLYQMIKNNYNIVVAVLISTGLFTFAHGGAFEAGILPVLNVITMSLFVTAVLEYTESLVAPIVIHFLWNGVGAIILGGVSLAEDYPHLFNMVISGNSILSGGSCKIEGSIVVLFMNLILMFGFVMAKKIRDKNL